VEEKENEIMHRECELYHYHQHTLEENANVVATNVEKEGEK
jgi:hypothetical protein